MKFGQYVKELFDDFGSYVSSHKKEATVYTSLLLAPVIFSGCSKEKKSSLEEGGKYKVEASIAGDEKEYVILDTEYKGLPDEKVSKRHANPSDIVLCAGDSTESKRLDCCLDGKTIRIKRIRKEGFYETTDGELRYNAAPGDIEIYDAKEKDPFKFRCADESVTQKSPVKEPAKKPYRSSKVAKPVVQKKKSAPDTVIMKHVYDEPQIQIVEVPVYIESQPQIIVEREIIIENHYPIRRDPCFFYGGYQPWPNVIVVPAMPRQPIRRRHF